MEILYIHDIEIERLNGLIPNLLYNKLIKYQIKNIKELLEIDIEEFRNKGGVGSQAVDLLIEFKDKIEQNPDIILKEYESKIYQKIYIDQDSELGMIPIKELKDLIGNKVFNKLLCSSLG